MNDACLIEKKSFEEKIKEMDEKLRQSEKDLVEKNDKIKKLELARDSAMDELRAETSKNTSRI